MLANAAEVCRTFCLAEGNRLIGSSWIVNVAPFGGRMMPGLPPRDAPSAANEDEESIFKVIEEANALPVAPVADAGPRGWKVTVRMLGFRVANPEPLLLPPGWTYRQHERPSRESLEKIFHWVYDYPLGLVLGDPDLYRAAFAARRGLRLSESTGVFRGIRQEAKEEAAAEDE